MLKQLEGYRVAVEEVIEVRAPDYIPYPKTDHDDVVTAYDLLQMFKCLFVEWTFIYGEGHTSRSLFEKLDSTKSFRIVEIELGFLYDLLHTKAMVLYTKWELLLRSFTFSSTLLVLVLFSRAKKSHLSKADRSITYLLLAVIVFFEAYSIFMLVFSDWSDVWLCKHNKCGALRDYLRCALNFMRLPRRPRWSHSIAQLSFLSFCTKERPLVCHKMLQFLKIDEKLEKYHYTFHEKVSDDLRECIFIYIHEKLNKVKKHLTPIPTDIHECLTELLKRHGLIEASWAVEGEFDQVVQTWHIVTEILYHLYTEQSDTDQSVRSHFRTSMLLSRYMLYLLVMHPLMLPCIIPEIRLRDNFAEAFKFFEDQRLPNDRRSHLQQAFTTLLNERTEAQPSELRGACWIVAKIRERRVGIWWELIRELWANILMYTASKFRGDRHAGQLRRGGELLTHVWLMMAHFGLTDHFKMIERQVVVKVTAT